jgi:hypothetical protein
MRIAASGPPSHLAHCFRLAAAAQDDGGPPRALARVRAAAANHSSGLRRGASSGTPAREHIGAHAHTRLTLTTLPRAAAATTRSGQAGRPALGSPRPRRQQQGQQFDFTMRAKIDCRARVQYVAAAGLGQVSPDREGGRRSRSRSASGRASECAPARRRRWPTMAAAKAGRLWDTIELSSVPSGWPAGRRCDYDRARAAAEDGLRLFIYFLSITRARIRASRAALGESGPEDSDGLVGALWLPGLRLAHASFSGTFWSTQPDPIHFP